MKIDAIFEGGGVKGISFCGAISYLEEQDYTFNNLAGTSAGSIIASLLAIGYTGSEIKQILERLDYNKFMGKDKLQSIPFLGKYLELLFEKGMYDSSYIESWISQLLLAKGKTKFKDVLDENGNSRLKIIASDITKQEMLVFPNDLSKYGIDPMEFEIAKAVRMSCNIPLFFKPYKLEYGKNKVSLITDGGILSNYPVWVWDGDGMPTFGFKFSDNVDLSNWKVNLIDYIKDMINTVVDRDESYLLSNKNYERTIVISTNISATNFNLTQDQVKDLYQVGYQSTKQFLSTWDVQDYIKRYEDVSDDH
jgi:NTE family protein